MYLTLNILHYFNSITKGWVYKWRLKEFDIDDLCEDPTADKDWVTRFERVLKQKSFSNEQIALMLKNSKMCNWPEKFRSKELIRKNKDKFKELIGN